MSVGCLFSINPLPERLDHSGDDLIELLPGPGEFEDTQEAEGAQHAEVVAAAAAAHEPHQHLAGGSLRTRTRPRLEQDYVLCECLVQTSRRA